MKMTETENFIAAMQLLIEKLNSGEAFLQGTETEQIVPEVRYVPLGASKTVKVDIIEKYTITVFWPGHSKKLKDDAKRPLP